MSKKITVIKGRIVAYDEKNDCLKLTTKCECEEIYLHNLASKMGLFEERFKEQFISDLKEGKLKDDWVTIEFQEYESVKHYEVRGIDKIQLDGGKIFEQRRPSE